MVLAMNDANKCELEAITRKLAKVGLIEGKDGKWVPTKLGLAVLQKQKVVTH